MMPPRDLHPFALPGSAHTVRSIATEDQHMPNRVVQHVRSPRLWISYLVISMVFACHQYPAFAENRPRPEYSFSQVIQTVQPKIVKIFGAGGLRGLESYQSGFLISSAGHVLTAWSYVLDTEVVTVVLDDGRKFQGRLVGSDPRLEIAVLKIDGEELPYFDLKKTGRLDTGSRVLAFSNLFGVATGDESASVLLGHIATTTHLSARRGTYKTRYQGPVYVVDATINNPGAAGGALTDRQGQLVGVLGKELRHAENNTWLNYAIPSTEVAVPVENILAGKMLARHHDNNQRAPQHPHTITGLGIVPVSDVLENTPPYIERLLPHSAAARAELQPDDLILFVADKTVPSIKNLRESLRKIDEGDVVRLLVLRDEELVEVELRPDESTNQDTLNGGFPAERKP